MTHATSHITVIGAGTMGAQIAMVSALSGFTTALVDISAEQLDSARTQLDKRLIRDIEKGRRHPEDVRAAWSRLSTGTDLTEAAAETDFVIEAASEDIAVKRSLFAELDGICPEHAILTTNSSNIVPSRVADATNRPELVCNMHFFNPALVMTCVEVVPHSGTRQETVEAAIELAEAFGKEPVRLRQEIPGFVANRLLGALRKEALALESQGVADFKDIDRAARAALRHPMGPFELMDLVGIDVVHLIRLAEYEQTGDPASLPAQSIREKYEAGEYGRKTGKGWYDYS